MSVHSRRHLAAMGSAIPREFNILMIVRDDVYRDIQWWPPGRPLAYQDESAVLGSEAYPDQLPNTMAALKVMLGTLRPGASHRSRERATAIGQLIDKAATPAWAAADAAELCDVVRRAVRVAYRLRRIATNWETAKSFTPVTAKAARAIARTQLDSYQLDLARVIVRLSELGGVQGFKRASKVRVGNKELSVFLSREPAIRQRQSQDLVTMSLSQQSLSRARKIIRNKIAAGLHDKRQQREFARFADYL